MTASLEPSPEARAKGGPQQMLLRALNRQFSSLAEYNYRLFFMGQGVSQIGTWMQTVGQGWLVLQLTGSAAALGIVTMIQAIPFTVLSLVGGQEPDSLHSMNLTRGRKP